MGYGGPLKKKKKQIDTKRIREGIGRGGQLAGRVEGELKEQKRRNTDEKVLRGKEAHHHHQTKPEEDGACHVERGLHHRCLQASQLQHWQKGEEGGGHGEASPWLTRF